MYSRGQQVINYLRYYLSASNSRGFGTHSPFVYDFIKEVLVKRDHGKNSIVDQYRQKLLKDNREIEIEDYGAGSFNNKSNNRKVSSIARSALKNRKYASLLVRIANHYHCKSIIELGTSLGTTTALLATEVPDSQILTFEGATQIANIAENFFQSAGLKNIRVVRGNFDNTISQLLPSIDSVDLVFVDGNHREEPTVRYFQSFLAKIHNDSIFIFDDIHWSQEMENAWKTIISNEAVTLSIDMFFVGVIFFRKENKIKQHFKIRF